MNKLLVSLIIISSSLPALGARATKSARATLSNKDKTVLSAMISTFDITTEAEGLKIEVRNVNGQQKLESLTVKAEEYQEYTKYTFKNPYQENHNLDLYIFEKVKPVLLDDRETAGVEADIADLRFDLQVLLDTATKKTIKSKVAIYYKETLIAEGSADNNAQIKIKDDLSGKVKNCKLQELKVTKNLLGSDKRSLDLEVKYAQSGKLIKQKLNVNLLNMKLTPVTQKIDEEDETEEIEQDLEGEKNETSTTDS